MSDHAKHQRIGIFGGTFDPVHYGHLLLAETCREQLNLDSVVLLPAGSPPHKSDSDISPASHRLEMLKLAVSGCPEFQIDERELKREGPSYTVLTLQELSSEQPDSTLYFLMGADSLRDIPGWKDPQQILQLATVVAVNRPGIPLPETAEVRVWAGDLADSIQVIQTLGTDLSSSTLRSQVAANLSIRFMTPRAVGVYIEQHELYRTAAS
ncbi:MAG TPA: nicotinic acid mononucleotide adenylyltransferase [Planctomycetaceae bacterium]|nr:nicotinic acid mononucleotide adenylyltransferase [Planctomycetaceae bacterium]